MNFKMSDKQAIRRLIGLLINHKYIISIIIGNLMISAALNFCIPLISRRIMDDGFNSGDRSLLVKLAIVSFFIYVMIILLDLITEKLRV